MRIFPRLSSPQTDESPEHRRRNGAGRRRQPSKNFAHAPFGAIADDGITDAARSNDAEPIASVIVLLGEQGQEPACHAPAAFLHGDEFAAIEDELGRRRVWNCFLRDEIDLADAVRRQVEFARRRIDQTLDQV